MTRHLRPLAVGLCAVLVTVGCGTQDPDDTPVTTNAASPDGVDYGYELDETPTIVGDGPRDTTASTAPTTTVADEDAENSGPWTIAVDAQQTGRIALNDVTDTSTLIGAVVSFVGTAQLQLAANPSYDGTSSVDLVVEQPGRTARWRIEELFDGDRLETIGEQRDTDSGQPITYQRWVYADFGIEERDAAGLFNTWLTDGPQDDALVTGELGAVGGYGNVWRNGGGFFLGPWFAIDTDQNGNLVASYDGTVSYDGTNGHALVVCPVGAAGCTTLTFVVDDDGTLTRWSQKDDDSEMVIDVRFDVGDIALPTAAETVEARRVQTLIELAGARAAVPAVTWPATDVLDAAAARVEQGATREDLSAGIDGVRLITFDDISFYRDYDAGAFILSDEHSPTSWALATLGADGRCWQMRREGFSLSYGVTDIEDDRGCTVPSRVLDGRSWDEVR